MMQPAGTGTPLFRATLILPSAIVQAEMSQMSGGRPIGMPAAIGLADSRRSMPPNGATRMPARRCRRSAATSARRAPPSRPVADAAEMARVPQRDHRHAVP